MDTGKITARIISILTKPKSEWPVIADEPGDAASLYKEYILVVAAIPAIFGFLRWSVIGFGFWGASGRVGVGAGLSHALLSYSLGLISVLVMAWLVDALAPTFGGQRNSWQALKTVAYAATTAWVAGAAAILPMALAGLINLAALVYVIYLLYLGLPNTMKCPQDKSVGYTAVVIVVAIIVGAVIGTLLGRIIGMPAMYGTHHPAMSITRDDATVTGNELATRAAAGNLSGLEALKDEVLKQAP